MTLGLCFSSLSLALRAFAHASLLLLLGGCSHVFPSELGSTFAGSPADLAPVVLQSVAEEQMTVSLWDKAGRRMLTRWRLDEVDGNKIRERFAIRWVPTEDPEQTEVYVRHSQERPKFDTSKAQGAINQRWESLGRDEAKERRLLGKIEAKLAAFKALPENPKSARPR